MGGRQILFALPHIRADLGDDDDLVAVAAAFHPFADDRLGFAALVAGHPARIGVRRVDGVEAGAGEPVEQVEGGLLVGGPAEDITAQNQRRVTGYGFPNALRMSVGTEEANRGVIDALTTFLKS
jgi:hypothetical protein